MAYDTPTPRGIRKPLKSELAQLARLFAENADDTDQAIDDLETSLSGTYAPFASQFEIGVLFPAAAHIAFDSIAKEAAAYLTTIRFSSGAVNDTVVFSLPRLFAGTWTVVLSHMKNTDAGIYHIGVSADGASWTELGTVDGYAASYAPARSLLTGVTVPAEMNRLRVVMATKNASSSSYVGRFDYIAGVQTA